jgi:hypothetical protein
MLQNLRYNVLKLTSMKFLLVLLSIFFILFTTACENKIEIVNPSITTRPYSSHLLDTITHTVIAEAKIDGEIVEIDSYTWTIENELGELINPITEDNSKVIWMPLKTGLYTVKVTVSVDNKSLTEIIQLNIEFSDNSVFKYMEGEWIGTGHKSDGAKWIAQFDINDKGHYTGKIVEVLNGSITAVFNHLGIDSIVHPDKTIEIYSLADDSTFIGRYSFVNTKEVFFNDFNAIRFRNNFKALYLEAFNYGDTIFYNLKKQ